MLSADEVRKFMPARAPVTKEEFLANIDKRIIAAAKEGAVSIWITEKEGYDESSAVIEQVLSILRDKGYRLVQDTYNNKPAIRIYWVDEPEPSEWEVQYVPYKFWELIFNVTTMATVWAVFFGAVAFLVAGLLNYFWGHDFELFVVATNYAFVGFIVTALFLWVSDTGKAVRKKRGS
ncbi:hypothetical protein SAMN03159475_0112 [Pseudomonas sp. NFPP33]|nr:hypothetical protein [Pseudomonas sp. NFPP33]AGH89242.1 hypothetical protein [uncultured bacterium]SDA85339.1 hypothetical protein SAMN03159475_0112 [Pseudomonas sp. NFPP33]